MTSLDPLLERNRAFATTGAHTGLSIMPNQPIFVVTCLDPRVDPAAFLGLGLGDAPMVRNGGGRMNAGLLPEWLGPLAFLEAWVERAPSRSV